MSSVVIAHAAGPLGALVFLPAFALVIRAIATAGRGRDDATPTHRTGDP
ncbi:MAG TPA: hypothetical protein VN213_04040 [Solirubrobacteraceae bacterium]|nr:hypothetical protein [Solirubrobacteraceae bacterium]